MQYQWKRLYALWQQDVTNLPLTLQLIDALFQDQAWQTCLELFEQLDEGLRNTPEICAKQIEFQIHQNHLPQAAQQAQALCELTAGHPVALHYLALTHYLNGDLATVLALEPTLGLTPETTILIARALYHKGELDRAFDKVAALTLPEAIGLKAMLCFDRDQLEQANTFADQALAMQSDQMDALLAKASYLVVLQQMNGAVPFIDLALRLQPKSGRALSIKGQIEFFNLHIDVATAIFVEAVKYMPDHIGTWHLLAWCYFITKEYDLAQQAFAAALNIDHNFAETHGGLAVIAVMQGDVDAAQVLATKALRLNGQSFAGLYARSLLAEQGGDLQGATAIVDGILAKPSHLAGQSYRDMISAVLKKNQKRQ